MTPTGWTCPDCGRSFARTQQQHSCSAVKAADPFEGKPPALQAIANSVIHYLSSLEGIQQEFIPGTVLFRVTSSFVGLKPGKNHVKLEFLLNHGEVVFPVYKVEKLSRSRFAHYIRIDEEEDFTQEIKDLLREAWEMNRR